MPSIACRVGCPLPSCSPASARNRQLTKTANDELVSSSRDEFVSKKSLAGFLALARSHAVSARWYGEPAFSGCKVKKSGLASTLIDHLRLLAARTSNFTPELTD